MQIKDIKASARHTAKLLPQSQRELFLSEIDSLIDKTVLHERERIVKMIEKQPNATRNEVENEKVICSDDIINLIKNNEPRN